MIKRASPHFDDRPADVRPSLLVIHNISLPPGEYDGPYIDDLFMGRLDAEVHPYFRDIAGLKVSAHYLIRRDGTLIQYVDPAKRAWHAGVSSWKGCERCNDFSIGVELEGSDDVPFAEPQYETLVQLTKDLFAQYGELDIAGHSDIAPQRKTDPGPWFDWGRFRAALT
ncbi:MAG TPA: 1,6-anhydro-N-acetylmuramyl-L-alanine amidase AmpD [Usitatibacter sp.]|nr:1,6-anhydro-N-acetylmuramyl-L-alanine amidase AmpD [Usitatibacter sp.]